jgi:diguanylate cyclase (GGDEF)-like protein/PAS domain S-box-containing protein
MRDEAKVPRRTIRADRKSPARRAAFLGELRTDRHFRWILVLYLAVVAVIISYTAAAIAHERGSALIINIASRQRALAERYVKDVVLVTDGVRADPLDDADQLLANAEALLRGGDVIAVHGADEETVIPPASDDPDVIAKLTQERRLIERLIETGDDLLQLDRSDPAFHAQLLELRVAGALVTSVSNDAVGTMTQDAEAAFGRLVFIGSGLGIVGAIAAIMMGLLMRRAGARRASQFRSLVHNASDLITVVNVRGVIEYQSPSSERLVGIGADRLVGKPLGDLVHPDDREYVDALLVNGQAQPGAVLVGEFRMLHSDGSTRHVDAIVSNLVTDPTVGGLVFNTRDVTDRKMLEEELERRAFFDSLTGLPNRAVFRDRLDHALARSARVNDALAVLLLDLDGFKLVNDSLGHDAGDELLVAVGGRIQACSRAGDTVARLGGDEFAILLEDAASEESAVALAGRLLEALASPFDVRGREVFIGASIGVTLHVGAAGLPDELIRNADAAMYAAKGGGKGRWAVFQPAMHRRTLEFFEMQADLQRALVRGEFVLHYQPIVDLATGKVQGVEALARWLHPTRGLIMPGGFIPVAEETGMMVPLGVWVLGEACRQSKDWRDRFPEAAVSMSVNLSTRQLLEPDLISRVAQILAESALDPGTLILEITEGSLMQDVGQTAAKLYALKELGIRLALDDFGTGSSSLGYLRQFPIDVLKIDKSFVDGIGEEGSDATALIRAIIQLARTLRLGTVAEGIESSEQLAELRRAGCDFGQGYLFAKPLAAEDIQDVLRRGEVYLGGALSEIDPPSRVP